MLLLFLAAGPTVSIPLHETLVKVKNPTNTVGILHQLRQLIPAFPRFVASLALCCMRILFFHLFCQWILKADRFNAAMRADTIFNGPGIFILQRPGEALLTAGAFLDNWDACFGE